jgi:uncharacterized ferredoxin-like protein
MIYCSETVEKEALFEVARLMAVAARTAPKTKGVDNILIRIVDGEDKDAVAAEMRRIAEGGDHLASFARDANNVDASAFVVFLAVRDNPPGLPLCGVCGHENCGDAKRAGAPCALNLSDLGTAACSACVVAANHFVDNRLMYTAGRAAMHIDLFGEKIRQCFGIPVSASGKSIYFDRK